MSAQNDRRQLESKRKQRVAAEKKVGECRTKEGKERAAATKTRTAADNELLEVLLSADV